jgi:pimeloyl-ACP methyl ester carboxylesterase
MVPYDEFALFHENAAEYDLPYSGPPEVRRVDVEVSPGRHVSGLIWGSGSPEVVLVHGGAQNAHTWDTVALALGRPLLAVDLPGHGHSDGGPDGAASAVSNGHDLANAITALAPDAQAWSACRSVACPPSRWPRMHPSSSAPWFWSTSRRE